MSDLFGLKDRVALVVGGSRGLGRQICLGFAEHGADVVVASRKLEACARVAAELEDASGRSALACACNVSSWEEIEQLVDQVYGRFGRLDVLVASAGFAPTTPDILEMSEALYDKVMGVNLKGPFRLNAVIGSRMADGGGGSIINISSMAAVRPQPNTIAYAAAKSGLNAMTVGFARLFGPAVRVNTIMPGPFLTDMSEHWDMEEFTARTARFALGRRGMPEEIVGAALYLAGDAATFTTGSVITVDGGSC